MAGVELERVRANKNCRMVRIILEFRIFEDVLYKFRFLTGLRHKI